MLRNLCMFSAFLLVASANAGKLTYFYLSKDSHTSTSGSGASWTTASVGAGLYEALATSITSANKPIGVPTAGGQATADGYEVVHVRLYWSQDYVGDIPPDIKFQAHATGDAGYVDEMTGTVGYGDSIVSTEAKVTWSAPENLTASHTFVGQPTQNWSAQVSGTHPVESTHTSLPWGFVKALGGGRARFAVDVSITMPRLKAFSHLYLSGYPHVVNGWSRAFTETRVVFKFSPA